MPSNPFRRKSAIDQVTERAAEARAGVIDAAESVREGAERLSSALKLAERTEPVRSPSRRAVALGAAGLTAAAVALKFRKRAATPEGGVPQPDVTPTTPGPAGGDLNDPALKAKVESELFRDSDLPKDRILVGVAGGVVTLRGSVDSPDQAELLTAQAEEIDGVRRVENLISAGNGAAAESSGTA